MNTAQMYQEQDGNMSRPDIQAAIAKAVELRALHAALMQGNSPGNYRTSPVTHHAPHFSAQDYPVFTPSYDDELLPGYQQILLENQNYAENWGDYALGGDNMDETISSEGGRMNVPSRKGLPSELADMGGYIHASDDQNSVTGSFADNSNTHRASPGPRIGKSRRNSLGDLRSTSSYSKCRPGIISSESDGATTSCKKSNIVVPLTDLHSSVNSRPRNKGLNLSWLFPRLKKKNKKPSSPSRAQSEEVSQVLKDYGMVSVERLKRELIEANGRRDAALMEVAEMKSSMGELSRKLENLETYCEELKKALKQAVKTKNPEPAEKLANLHKKGKSVYGTSENTMPVSEDVMIEGFLQIVSEARLSGKQFCKTLLGQIEETDQTLVDNLNLLLQPYKLSLNSKYSKAVLYHLESIINQSLYEDFENCSFQKNGIPKLLDPEEFREAQFQSFASLRNLSWNEVLRKGTKYYSKEFSTFCDQKMRCIITALGWTKPWPEQLLHSFFVTAKCIWLLHLLAFSFNPALGILRVDENRPFDSHYMEDILSDRRKSQGPSKVKVMVMPGFYVHDRVLKCRVLCRYKSVS